MLAMSKTRNNIIKSQNLISYVMNSTTQDLSKNRQLIIDSAVDMFKDMDYFKGLSNPPEGISMAVCEGLFDLMAAPVESSDQKVLRMFMEWLYNLLRKDGTKIDTTINFLDTYEEIVVRHLDKEERAEVDGFFEICRGIVENKHKELLRGSQRSGLRS